jgi:SAM-dependent methyltransferase
METLNPKWGHKYARKADVFATTPWWKAEAREVLSHIPYPVTEVMDLGCNTGRFIGLCKTGLDEGVNYYGVDVNPAALTIAAQRHTDCSFYRTPSLVPDGIGFVAFIHTINQVEDLDTLLGGVWDRMTPGAKIVVVTHNPLPARLRKPLNLFNGYKPDATMVREPTMGELKQLMYENGFRCEQAYYFGKFPIPFLRRRMIFVGVKPEV